MGSSSVNYTKEMTDKLVTMYTEHGNEGIPLIAEALDKPTRSIIAKLSSMGIYSPGEKLLTLEDMGKKQLLREIEKKGFNPDGLQSATKPALIRLLGVLPN